MGGYAATWELNFVAPPWGTVAWLVVGTGLTVGGALLLDKAISKSKSDTDAQAVPKAKERQDCKKEQYRIFVRAQGSDLGGDSRTTLAAPTQEQCDPFLVAQGIALSAATQAMLGKRQLDARVLVFAQLARFISGLPANGGWLGTKDFVAPGVRGGVRADTGSFGPSNNYLA